jgi:hypothetical protein
LLEFGCETAFQYQTFDTFRSDSMKKSTISLAVAATVATSAAVYAGQYVNPGKTGQALLFPFYNADNGNSTGIHITNTTDAVKAVKIRFLEYKNSDAVLDFNLYMSPKDIFAFAVIPDANGDGAAILTGDASCTVPVLGTAGGDFPGTATENADGSTTRIQPFVNSGYTGDADSSIKRSLTGHVEVIEMGVVSDETYAAAATHDSTGVPADCAALDTAWASGPWFADGSAGMSAPTGGLSGVAYHLNVESAASFGFEATAIDGFSLSAQHTNPGSAAPSISSGTSDATVQAENGAWNDYTLGSGAEAASAVLQTASLSNDVLVLPIIGGMTDWVVTFPTKRAHVDVATAADVVAPFTDNWDGSSEEGSACEPVSIGRWDRETSAAAAVETSICNGTSVIAMGAAGAGSALSASAGLTVLDYPYSEGWAKISFNNADQYMTLGGGATRQGLPAIGFAAYKVVNGAMSYGSAAVHKTEITSSGI